MAFKVAIDVFYINDVYLNLPSCAFQQMLGLSINLKARHRVFEPDD